MLFLEIIYLILALSFIFISTTSLGEIINNKIFFIKFHNYYENFISGIFIILLCLMFIHFFFPINSISTIPITILLFFSFLKKITNFKSFLYNKKFLLEFFLGFFIIFTIIINSNIYPFPDISDFGLYHKIYINYLNQSNIIFGFANIHDRFGYSGNSFLLTSFFNFYPNLNFGYKFTIPIFFTFILLFFISEFKWEKKSFKKNIFIIFSFYVLFKFIFVERLSDVAPYKIFLILALYIIYKKIFYEINKVENLINILNSISILISTGPYSWFFCLFYGVFIFYNKLLLIKKINLLPNIFFVSFYFITNFIKTGFIFFPSNINLFFYKFSWSISEIQLSDLLRITEMYPKQHVDNYNWILEWAIHYLPRTNYLIVYIILLSLFIFITLLKILKLSKIGNELKQLIILTLTIITWFSLSPDLRYGAPLIWLSIIVLASVISYQLLQSFKYSKILLPILILGLYVYGFNKNINSIKKNIDLNFSSKINYSLNYIDLKPVINKNALKIFYYDDTYLGDHFFATQRIAENFKNLKIKNFLIWTFVYQ